MFIKSDFGCGFFKNEKYCYLMQIFYFKFLVIFKKAISNSNIYGECRIYAYMLDISNWSIRKAAGYDSYIECTT